MTSIIFKKNSSEDVKPKLLSEIPKGVVFTAVIAGLANPGVYIRQADFIFGFCRTGQIEDLSRFWDISSSGNASVRVREYAAVRALEVTHE